VTKVYSVLFLVFALIASTLSGCMTAHPQENVTQSWTYIADIHYTGQGYVVYGDFKENSTECGFQIYNNTDEIYYQKNVTPFGCTIIMPDSTNYRHAIYNMP
jgi:hypothetical protein